MAPDKAPIRIVQAQDEVFTEALRFIGEQYQAVFGTLPVDIPDHLFVALQGEQIVGSMGINVAHEGSLRLKRIYRFDQATTPLPVQPDKTIEYGRWVATISGISDALIYRATCFALDTGKRYGWCEHGDRIHRICTRMGLRFYNVEARLELSEVAAADREFYTRNLDVRLYMIKLIEWQAALEGRVRARTDIEL